MAGAWGESATIGSGISVTAGSDCFGAKYVTSD